MSKRLSTKRSRIAGSVKEKLITSEMKQKNSKIQSDVKKSGVKQKSMSKSTCLKPDESDDECDFGNTVLLNAKQKTNRKRTKEDDNEDECVRKKKIKPAENSNQWTLGDRQRRSDQQLANIENIDIETARNITRLFEEGNTIPFLARYRKNLIGNLDPLKLRKIKSTFEHIKKVEEKAQQAIQMISKTNSASPALMESILFAESCEEIEFLVAPLKKEKQSLAQKAQILHLEKPAQQILEGSGTVCLENYINKNGLDDVKKVKLKIKHIISHIISKDTGVQRLLNKIIESKSIKILTKEKKTKKEKQDKSKSLKYEIYHDFTQFATCLKPHQILAIYRGEAEDELSVKVEIPSEAWEPITYFIQKKWASSGNKYELRETIISDSRKYAINSLLNRLVERRVRSRLKKKAEEEAVSVFGSNLRQLLLAPPCKGVVIMGIDPGFRNGCKVAVISQQGVPLTWTKFFLPNNGETSNDNSLAGKLKNLIVTYKCEVIALGNGKGCRETEELLSNLIKQKAFDPINVSYTIISEQGVSIYSCSPEAAKEFPNLDPMFIGAVSLARRLQDPLSELVKVEPKHLGVGLYQHDVKSNLLSFTLDEIVSECVSFVGVDLNTATLYLLKRVAGLNESKALAILKYRNEKCEFKSVEELKKVKGIGEKTFRQCAGFFRIVTSTSGFEINPLDQTIIHPESYETASAVAKNLKVDISDLGSEGFIDRVKSKLNGIDVDLLAKKFGVPDTDITLILDAFTQPANYDIRNPEFGPVFRKNISKIEDLKIGQTLTGVVQNVVPFGAFVDIGCTISGLIHSSKMNNKSVVLNDRVVVKVLSIDLQRKRIGLELRSNVRIHDGY